MPAIIGSLIKSSVTSLIPDLLWIGVAREVRSNVTKADIIMNMGLAKMNSRITFKKNAITELAITSYIADGSSGELTNKNSSFDLLNYLYTTTNGTGLLNPADYTSLLSSLSVTFSPRQATVGTFTSIIIVPNNQLIDYIEEQSDSPLGTGDQLDPLIGEEAVVEATAAVEGYRQIEGIANLSISCNTKVVPLEGIDGICHYAISGAPDISVNLTMYEKYFIQNQSLFDGSANMSDLSIGPFAVVKPKIISIGQNVTAESYKTFDIACAAKI